MTHPTEPDEPATTPPPPAIPDDLTIHDCVVTLNTPRCAGDRITAVITHPALPAPLTAECHTVQSQLLWLCEDANLFREWVRVAVAGLGVAVGG